MNYLPILALYPARSYAIFDLNPMVSSDMADTFPNMYPDNVRSTLDDRFFFAYSFVYGLNDLFYLSLPRFVRSTICLAN